MARCECRARHEGPNPVDHSVGGCPNDAHREKLCGPCAREPGPEQTKKHAAPISAPGSTLDDIDNDHAALTMALRLAELGLMVTRGETDGTREEYQTLSRWIEPLYSDGAGAFEPSALVVWLKERLAETENTISALDGSGPPLPPFARVLVTVEGGVIQDVSADVPDVEVIVVDFDDDGDTDDPRAVENDRGELGYWSTWHPSGNEQEQDSVRRAIPKAEEAERRWDEQHNSAPTAQATQRALEDVPPVPPCSDDEAGRFGGR